MNKIRFKTMIFETIYFIVFGLFITTITCLMAFKVYKESLTGFIICLFCSLLILILIYLFIANIGDIYILSLLKTLPKIIHSLPIMIFC